MGFRDLLPPTYATDATDADPIARRASGPLVVVKQTVARASFRWEGRIVAREWDSGFSEQEYRLMLVGGSRRRLASPDGVGAAGQPVWQLSDRERRMRDRLLGRALRSYETSNMACNAGRTVLLNLTAGVGGYSGVNYFAVGTGVASPTAADTQLGTEYFRKLLTTTTVSGNQVDLSTLFVLAEGNTTYTEAGLFGNGATGTVNSGSLFAHASYTYTKSSAVNLTNDYYVYFN